MCMIGSSMSMFFPAANPMNAILFAQKDLVTFKAEVVHGIISCVFLCVVASVVGFLYGSIIF